MSSKATNHENTRELALRVAIQEESSRKTDPNDSHEKSLIVIGSKEVGKTTMIYRFLEKEDVPKATLAMDYSYGRKAGKSLVKDVVHVWEVGHLTPSLISAAMRGSALAHSPHHTSILLMVNLAKPDSLWNALEDCLDAVRDAIRSSYTPEILAEMRKRRLASLREQMRPDDPSVADPFPFKLCIIGGRYDEFRSLYGDDRELIGQSLRAAAHLLGAGLHYHTAKESQALRKTRELLSNYGFKGQSTKANVTDYGKPLSVGAGCDSLEAIDLKVSYGRYVSTLDEIKAIYEVRFPQEAREGQVDLEEPSDDPKFSEPIVDRLRSQREQEMSVLLRDMLEAPVTNIPIPEPY